MPEKAEFCKKYGCPEGETVKKCYWKKAKKLHPDQTKDDGTAFTALGQDYDPYKEPLDITAELCHGADNHEQISVHNKDKAAAEAADAAAIRAAKAAAAARAAEGNNNDNDDEAAEIIRKTKIPGSTFTATQWNFLFIAIGIYLLIHLGSSVGSSVGSSNQGAGHVSDPEKFHISPPDTGQWGGAPPFNIAKHKIMVDEATAQQERLTTDIVGAEKMLKELNDKLKDGPGAIDNGLLRIEIDANIKSINLLKRMLALNTSTLTNLEQEQAGNNAIVEANQTVEAERALIRRNQAERAKEVAERPSWWWTFLLMMVTMVSVIAIVLAGTGLVAEHGNGMQPWANTSQMQGVTVNSVLCNGVGQENLFDGCVSAAVGIGELHDSPASLGELADNFSRLAREDENIVDLSARIAMNNAVIERLTDNLVKFDYMSSTTGSNKGPQPNRKPTPTNLQGYQQSQLPTTTASKLTALPALPAPPTAHFTKTVDPLHAPRTSTGTELTVSTPTDRLEGVNRLIASYTKMEEELGDQRARVGPEKFIPEKVGTVFGDKQDIVEQRNTANLKKFDDETSRVNSVSQLYNDVNDYIGLLKQEKHALEIDIKIPLTVEKWRIAETAGAELQRLSNEANAELTTGVKNALNQLIEVMGVGNDDIKGSNKQIAAALHKKVEMGKNTGISSSHDPLGYLGVRKDGLNIQQTYDEVVRPHLRKVLPAWLFQPDNPVANVIAQALKAQRYWGDATVVGKSPTFLTATRVTDETGILKGVHTITVPKHMSRDTYQAAQTSRWDVEMSTASTSLLRAFATGTDGFGATEIQKYKFSTLNVDVQWNSPSKLAIWLDTQFTRHMMVNIEKVVYNKEPKWTKDSIMNELNSKVLAEQAELAQVLFGNVLIEKANGDIEITSKTAHRDNLGYYIKYINSPHASSLATGCRTEYWNNRFEEIWKEISRVKNGKDEKITFAKVFVYNPINWVGSSITGTLKGAIGVVGDGVLSPALGALGTGLFTTVQSSLGLQDAHYLLQLSAAALCYYIILPAIISVTGAGGVVKNKITQGLLRWRPGSGSGSANPNPGDVAIPGSATDTNLTPQQIEDAKREEDRLIEANKDKKTKEGELDKTTQQITDGKIAIEKLDREMLANAQTVENKIFEYRNLADQAELNFLRKQAEAHNQQLTPYNRRRRKIIQSPAAGGADPDSDDELGGGKRANKKRATKKHGKRKSKRNAKDGARKTKTTRKKTTRKKRRGKK